jgi:tryptophanyl-tRNA synthetase
MAMKRLLSGIQPSGVVHLGNYVGAISRWTATQGDADAFYMVADLHALTLPYEPEELPRQTRETAAALIACGLDPDVVTLFVQSHVSEHTYLCWLLMALARVGDLRRMTHFKEKAPNEQEGANAALFAYPVLQAADVLLYQAEEVPVGDDQRQHLEMVSDLARRFNNAFGDTFVVPRGTLPPSGARVMDLQEPRSKMSKSSGSNLGTILLSDDDTTIRTKIGRAVTDSDASVTIGADKPGITNLIGIYASLDGVTTESVIDEFETVGYGEFKEAVAEIVCQTLCPMRERYYELLSEEDALDDILEHGAERARRVAVETLAQVRVAMGFDAERLPASDLGV